jgi:hypothetical protein
VTFASQDDALVLQADCSRGLGEHGDLALQTTSNTTSLNVDFCMCGVVDAAVLTMHRQLPHVAAMWLVLPAISTNQCWHNFLQVEH